MNVLDVNVLVYAFQPVSPHHAAARAWLQVARHDAFTAPDEVLAGFVRIVTNHRIFAPPASVGEALAFVEALRASPGWREPARPSARWRLLREICEERGLRGAQVPDAWLAALAMGWEATLVSADRGFSGFRGLRWLNPL
jgi:toxin-antitoxin system PIN domain toxin